MTLAVTLRGVVEFGAWWLLLSLVLGMAVGKFIRGNDVRAEELHRKEQRRRRRSEDRQHRRRR